MKIRNYVFLFLIFSSCNYKKSEKAIQVPTNNIIEEPIAAIQENIEIPPNISNGKDSLILINSIKSATSFKQDTAYKKYEKITAFKRININGTNAKIVFIEFEYGNTSGASWPGKFQTLFTENGKLIGSVFAESYKFVTINKNEKPYLFTLETTQHGNGGHGLYKLLGDTLENAYDGFSDYYLRTYDANEDHSINEPFELEFGIKDFNNDGINDISFSGSIINYNKKTPVNFQFIFNKETGHFIEKEDYCKRYKELK